MPKTKNVLTMDKTELHTWFERDRAHVELRNKINNETIVEWWDEAVYEAVLDGFLSDKGFIMGKLIDDSYLHQSAYDYAKEHDMLPEDHNRWQVIVGNVGTVYDGDDEDRAHGIYHEYVQISKHGCGRAAKESVILLSDEGDVIKEFEYEEVECGSCGWRGQKEDWPSNDSDCPGCGIIGGPYNDVE